MTVKVVTDSVADLPVEAVRELGITVVPLVVRFGAEVYRDGVDLTAGQFYEKLKNSPTLPVTSAPPPGAYAGVYDKLAEETDEIVVITVTSKLSATYQVALQSTGLMKRKCRVEVFDSQWAAMAQGFITIRAAEAARAGVKLEEVLYAARRNITRVDMRAAFDSLEYLRRGGRIGQVRSLIGSILKINPIIGMREGKVYPFGRERSWARAVDHLYRFAVSFVNVEGLAIEYATNLGDTDRLTERFSARFPRARIYRSRASPVIGTHTGPGLLVVTVLGDRK